MRYCSHRLPLISILLLFSTLSFGQAWSGILAPGRAIDWSYTGIPGGVPSGSWPCSTTLGTVTTTTINSALGSAPNNTAVCIPAGSYTLSGSVYANRSNVVLRGAGPTQTTITLNGSNILMGNGTGGQGSAPGGLGSTTLSTLTQGSKVLTVGSTTGMSAGQIVAIYEANPSYIFPTGNEGNENATWCPSPSLSFFGCSTRSMAEMVQISSINSSTSITIAPPGLSINYSSGSSPQVFYWSTSGVYSYDGVENMTVDAGTTTASNYAVALVFCNFCWIKNVALLNAHRAGFYSFLSYRDEIRDSYLSATNTAGAPTQYGIECDRCEMSKIENNIIFGDTTPIQQESAFGNVVSYNYDLRTPVDNQLIEFETHRSHNYDQLYEGNVLGKLGWDNVWGSASHNTAFRNRLSGHDPNTGNYRSAFQISADQRYLNLAGNVLGDPTYHTQYVCDNTQQLSSDTYIYDLGWWYDCPTGSSINYDTVVESSLMRWGNWDAVTYCANGGHAGTACGSSGSNGVRWCTGSGAGNPACTASETGSTDPTFPGLSSPSTTLPASFYLSSQPSWWSTPWGTPVWPPIGPDVTCTTNCIANTANHAAKIPAELCYENTAQSSGFLTGFDASACYGSGSTAPAAPKGLTIVVQ